MGRGLLAIDKCDNVWVMQGFEYMDLGVKVLFELLVKFVKVDRLDGYEAWLFLQDATDISGILSIGLLKTSRSSDRRAMRYIAHLLRQGDKSDKYLQSMKPYRLSRSSLGRSLPVF